MDSFYIVTNPMKDKDLEVTRRVVNFLRRYKKFVFPDTGLDGSHVDAPEDIDCVISIGGDGTMVKAIRDMADRDVLFVGINLGTIGFLTDVETSSLESALQRLMDGRYDVEERMMITGSINGENSRLAMNDITLARTGPLSVLEYRVYVNDSFLTSYRADGVIVSTPTGSTGYNLSAGGPIVKPNSGVIVITPICAHTLNSRSIVLGDSDVIRVEVVWDRVGGAAQVSYDGENNTPLNIGDAVTIKRAPKRTKFVRMSRESFVTLLSQKLK
ncbi:MAG: NAD(+)/NADH kinase [Lachnospiraceae bacterium]|nr:NAD(+)/NADH kinase [Lachnospiraceae bacterium]